MMPKKPAAAAKATKKSKAASPAKKAGKAAEPEHIPASPPTKVVKPRPKDARSIDVIRHSRELMLVPRLFALGNEDRALREIVPLPKEAATLTFRYDALGAFDLMVLLAIISLCGGISRGEQPVAFHSADNSPEGKVVWNSLGEKARSAGATAVLVVTSRRQLAELACSKSARHNQSDLDRVMNALQKLGRAQIHYKTDDGKIEFTSNLIGPYTRNDDKVGVVVNPRIVNAVMERVQGKWSLISMNSLRSIRSEVGKILYHRLCATIDEGRSMRLNEDTLLSYVWRTATTTSTELRDRRRYLYKAFEQLEALEQPWGIIIHDARRGVPRAYTIRRPIHQVAAGLLDFSDRAEQHELPLKVLAPEELEAP